MQVAQFYTLNGHRLPLCERIGDQRAFPVLLQINNERIFALNFSTQYKIQNRDKSESKIFEEEFYFDFARDIGIHGYQKYSLPYISHKMMNALPKKQQITTADIEDSLTAVMRYMSRSQEDVITDKISDDKTRLDQLEAQVGITEAKIEQLRASASRKATMLLGFGSSIVLAQFAIIFQGTFHYLSWDIMEPVCYLMQLGNFTFGYAFYLAMKKDLDLTNFHEILTIRFTERACAQQGIDLAAHEAMKEEID